MGGGVQCFLQLPEEARPVKGNQIPPIKRCLFCGTSQEVLLRLRTPIYRSGVLGEVPGVGPAICPGSPAAQCQGLLPVDQQGNAPGRRRRTPLPGAAFSSSRRSIRLRVGSGSWSLLESQLKDFLLNRHHFL
ncbi:hypothetical protein EYF80_007688 [Liparis tanakae]|uniref:Uncharacterized protein n=1 Tax=Liparis tanakae TaxID=230148 RepID=A0A4Z2IXN1_9TELE|nr:hypothetical protein EYF80_007688 [Liparis tanakae]